MAPIKNDWVDGQTVNAAAMNTAADAVNANTTAVATLIAPTYRIDSYSGADPTGATFSDAAVAAALTARGTSKGTIEFGVGTYKLNTTILLDRPGQGIRGQGSGLTTLDWRGTGDCIRQWDSTVATDGSASPGTAGPTTGFQIYGWNNTNTNTNGLHIGDLAYIFIQDVRVQGLNKAGCKGFWGELRYSWAERTFMHMHVESCTDAFFFEKNASHPLTQTSWSYGWFFLSFDCFKAQNAITLKNKIGLLGADLSVYGNTATDGTGIPGTVLTIGTTSGDSSIIDGRVHLYVEAQGSGTGYTDIRIGAAAYLHGYGTLQFNEFPVPYVAGTGNFGVVFEGPTQCPSLGISTGAMNTLAWQYKETGGANLLYDPFFRDTFSREHYSVHGGEVLSYSTEQAKSGTQSLKFITSTATATNNDGFYLSTHNLGGEEARTQSSALKVQPGQTFYVEIWARQKATNTNTAGGVGVSFTVRDSTGVNAEAYPSGAGLSQTAVSNSAWTKISGTVTIPTGYDLAWLTVSISGTTVASQSWYFDNARLIDITETTLAITDSTMTMAHKTLTEPLIDGTMYGTNGLAVLKVDSATSAVNYLGIANRITGGGPVFSAFGSDANIGFAFAPKGAFSGISVYSSDAGTDEIPMFATGANANVGWNMHTQGTGRIEENGHTVGSWVAIPSTATSVGATGQMACDNSWLYICTGTNTWRRVAIATW